MQARFPIIVTSAQIGGPELRDHLLSFPTFDIVLFSKLFTVAELRNAVLQLLGPNPRQTQHLISLARPNRTARIVLLDHEPAARAAVTASSSSPVIASVNPLTPSSSSHPRSP